MTKDMSGAWRGWCLRFLGVVEVLGGLGLVLPGLLSITPWLAPRSVGH